MADETLPPLDPRVMNSGLIKLGYAGSYGDRNEKLRAPTGVQGDGPGQAHFVDLHKVDDAARSAILDQIYKKEGLYEKAFPDPNERDERSTWEEMLSKGTDFRDTNRLPPPQPAQVITAMEVDGKVVGFVVGELYWDATQNRAVGLISYCVRDENYSSFNTGDNNPPKHPQNDYYPPEWMIQHTIAEMQAIAGKAGGTLNGVIWETNEPDTVEFYGKGNWRNTDSMHPVTRDEVVVNHMGGRLLKGGGGQPPTTGDTEFVGGLKRFSLPIPSDTPDASLRYADASDIAFFDNAYWEYCLQEVNMDRKIEPPIKTAEEYLAYLKSHNRDLRHPLGGAHDKEIAELEASIELMNPVKQAAGIQDDKQRRDAAYVFGNPETSLEAERGTLREARAQFDERMGNPPPLSAKARLGHIADQVGDVLANLPHFGLPKAVGPKQGAER